MRQAEALGSDLAKQKTTTSKVRGIFRTVRHIEMNWDPAMPEKKQRWAQRELKLLKPKLVYQAARHRKQPGGGGLCFLKDILSSAIEKVGQDRGKSRHFVDFFEAILAHHHVHGGD